MALELMDHVAIPYNWKEFEILPTSILSLPQDTLLEEEKSKEGRPTIFFTPLNLFGENSDEEAPSDDLSIPRKVRYHSNWKPTQDVVYWVNSVSAQDHGLRFMANKI